MIVEKKPLHSGAAFLKKVINTTGAVFPSFNWIKGAELVFHRAKDSPIK